MRFRRLQTSGLWLRCIAGWRGVSGEGNCVERIGATQADRRVLLIVSDVFGKAPAPLALAPFRRFGLNVEGSLRHVAFSDDRVGKMHLCDTEQFGKNLAVPLEEGVRL